MLPPSDSFQHQQLKLAEALSNIQAIEVPPPSYTAMPVTNESFHAYGIDDDDDEDDEDCLTPLAPITVHIDASIRIDGQGNTIILPPTLPSPNSNSNAVQVQPSVSATPPGQPAPASHTRVERLTSTILTALKDAGAVGSSSSSGRQRPLKLHVNASVNVNGERNVICAGTPRVKKDPKDAVESGGGVVVVQRGGDVVPEGSRKRRAESEPVEVPKRKRASP